MSATPIQRFSSRRQKLAQSFLAERLGNAKAYDRIAGYFCGSILETAGEAIDSVTGPIRVVCNSGLRPEDVNTARPAAAALRQEWCGSKPEALVDAGGELAKSRFSRLYKFLSTGKLQVKVLPDQYFGLVHGKAGVITLADSTKTSFMGSVNESKSAWTLNYELLWEHQKFFVKLAFDAHMQNPGGARFVLADQVGLGKTIQLAMAAELMVLAGDKPVLILAPKTLVWQWQDELLELLDMPSAVWTGKNWIDENEVEYPPIGPDGIKKCPRRVGIVPSSRATFHCADAELLKTLSFECIIVDESHNARRQNLGPGRDAEKPDPNNLLAYLYEMSTRTKSMLLATATPVQLRPVEAWDLLDILSRGSDAVLGGMWSNWRRAADGLALVMGDEPPPKDDLDMWQWIRTPMPPRSEHRDFEILRRSLEMPDDQPSANGTDWERLKAPDKTRVRQMFPRFLGQHNPFIRHIVRRSRKYLEETKDPATGEPYLKPIAVELLGERGEDAIRLPLYLREAYTLAEQFCHQLSQRMQGSGFLKTLLLRRVGSSIAAGRATVEKLLNSWQDIDAAIADEEGDEEEHQGAQAVSMSRTPTMDERTTLERFLKALEASQERDPKYAVVLDCLTKKRLARKGLHHLQPVLRFHSLAGRPTRSRPARRTHRDLRRLRQVRHLAGRPLHPGPARGHQTASPAWTNSPAAWHRRRIRGPQPPAPVHPHKPGPALESNALGTAQRPHSAHRPVERHRPRLQHAVPRLRRRPRPPTLVPALARNLYPVRPGPRCFAGRMD